MPMPAHPPTRTRTVAAFLFALLAPVALAVPAVLSGADPAEAGPAPNATQTAHHGSPDPRPGVSDAEQRRIDAAKDAGCSMAGIARRATRDAHIPFYVGCAFLQQETGGGRNVFGHDPTVFAGAGEVTRAKYLAYKQARQRTGQMQGVGPMQLTWTGYQQQADRLGGAWRPYVNMLVGFRHLAELHRSSGSWTAAAHEYNGGGPTAAAYAAQMAHRFGAMRDALT